MFKKKRRVRDANCEGCFFFRVLEVARIKTDMG